MTITRTYDTNSTIENLKEGDVFSITDSSVLSESSIYIKSIITMVNPEDSESDPELVPIYIDLYNGKFININNGNLKVHVFENAEIIVR